MGNRQLREQAEAISSLLPALMRQLLNGQMDPAGGLPLRQLRVCAILQEGPRPMTWLSRSLGISLSATTQIADRLERAGLVRRVAQPSDRRIRWLQLTERAESMMRQRNEVRVRRVRAAIEQLPAEARSEILAALERLMAACQTNREEEPAAMTEIAP